MKLENQVTGNIGMYYACYKLSCMGWNVMPTARNARGIDIIAYKKNGIDFIGIQVKTISKRNPVPLSNSLDKVMGEFWIIENNVTIAPNSFIMLPAEITKLAHKGEKNDAISWWLQPNSYDKPEFKEAWHRIGYGHEIA